MDINRVIFKTVNKYSKNVFRSAKLFAIREQLCKTASMKILWAVNVWQVKEENEKIISMSQQTI